MLAEYLCRQTDCLVRYKRSICKYVKRQLIIIRNLTHTGILDGNVDSLHGCVNGIDCDNTNRKILRLVFIRTYIAPASGNGQFHVKLCILTAQSRDHQIGIQNLNILIHLNVGSSHNALALILDVSGFHLVCIAVVLDGKALDVHDDLSHILFYSGNGTELVEDAFDLNLTYRHAGQGRQHNPPE